MKCATARKLISDYVDGNLETRKTQSLKGHLNACPDCRHLLEDFRGIVQKAKDLKEFFPAEETWLQIRSKLEAKDQEIFAFQPQKRRLFSFLSSPTGLKYALSSALILVLIIGGLVVGLRYRRSIKTFEGGILQRYTLAKLNEAEHHYQLAIEALREAVSAQEGKMDSQIANVFRANLEIIDDSIASCRKIILKEPENLEARNYLLAAYRKKVDFLNEMIEIGKTYSQKRELKTTI